METIANYTLRSKDKPLIQFTLQAELEELRGVKQYKYQIKILNKFDENIKLLPYTLRQDLNEQSLLDWINKRKAPKNRQFVDQIMNAIEDDNNPLKYVDISHALSLNDAYWITNDNIEIKWKDFNLYEHPFNEILAYIAFTGHSKKVPGVVSSPELTSSGMLKKCWTNRKDGIYLLKGDKFIERTDNRSQATMEFYAAQIAKKMDFDYIDYDLEEFNHHTDPKSKEIVCKCKLFTSEDVGFINAYDYFLANNFDTSKLNLSEISNQIKMAKLYGEKEYQDLMVFDSIICNQDRHLGNFGYLVNNDTGEFLRPAPIFDNGFSLLAGAAEGNLNNLENYINSISGKFLNFNSQAQLFIQSRHIPKVRSLLNFSFQKHPHYNVSDNVLEKLSNMIQIRARQILDIYKRIPKLQKSDELTDDVIPSDMNFK